MNAMTERIRPYNDEPPLPERCSQREMEEVVLGHLSVTDIINRVNKIEYRSRWLESITQTLDSFEARSWKDMQAYALRNDASRWALSVVPNWMAAGMLAGIKPGAIIRNPTTLWMFCGMETKKYLPTDHTRDVIDEILGDLPDEAITDYHLRKIANRVDRPPSLVGKSPTRQEIFMWATKRRHSEFLRTISLRLGEWIEENKASKYYPNYIESLEKQGEQSLHHGSGSALAELQRHARSAAVRAFLSDYYKRLPDVLQR